MRRTTSRLIAETERVVDECTTRPVPPIILFVLAVPIVSLVLLLATVLLLRGSDIL